MNEFKIQVDEFTITDPSHSIGPDAQYFNTPEKSIAYYGKYHEDQIREWYAKHFKTNFKCDLNREVDVAVANVCRQYGFDKPEGLLYDDAVEQLSDGLSEAYDAAEVKLDEELKDYCSEEYAETDWSVIVNEVKEHFSLNKASVIAIKIDEYVRYNKVSDTSYEICNADDLYRVLAEIVDGSDCKNGCQLYTDHFQITGGSCFDPKTDKQVGFRITKVYFKEIAW